MLLCGRGRGAGSFLEQVVDFALFGVPARLLFTVDQFAIHFDLKPTTAGGDEDDLLDSGGEIVQEFVRQTDGAGAIVSHLAVFDADCVLSHGRSLLSRVNLTCNVRKPIVPCSMPMLKQGGLHKRADFQSSFCGA